MKLANPLYYPIAVLASGIVLFIGVRLASVSSVIMLPASAVVATAGASVLKSREPEGIALENPELNRELQGIKSAADTLAQQAEQLRREAEQLLTKNSAQLELLTSVQYTCDRASELPNKIDALSSRLQGADSLLSVKQLQKQLAEVRQKLDSSSGVAREQLDHFADSLQRNIQLAQAGRDARQAQVISLSTLISDSAGVLQELQNKLRTYDLEDSEQIRELRSLNEELTSFQENVDLLVSRSGQQ